MGEVAGILQQLLGIEPRALAWAAIGGVFGAPLAPQAGRVRQVLVFIASSCICALLGAAAGTQWHAGANLWRDVWSAGLAFIFHPASAAVVKLVPEVVAGLAARYVASRQKGDPSP